MTPKSKNPCGHRGKTWTNHVELVEEDGRRVYHQHLRCLKCEAIWRCAPDEVVIAHQ